MINSVGSWIVLAIGFAAQGCFSARILAQWFISERKRKVVSPTIFWIFSLIGSYLFFIYGVLRDDFSIILGQLISYYIYIWNLKIKGVLVPRNSIGQKLLNYILIITPFIAIGYLAKDWQTFKSSFLTNENIPTLLIVYGSCGQIIFTFRFIYQYLYSKKRNESQLPKGFWIISLIGSSIIISYAIIRKDPILILGQSFGFLSYCRNLVLIKRGKNE